jgi:hypothetical protein
MRPSENRRAQSSTVAIRSLNPVQKSPSTFRSASAAKKHCHPNRFQIGIAKSKIESIQCAPSFSNQRRSFFAATRSLEEPARRSLISSSNLLSIRIVTDGVVGKVSGSTYPIHGSKQFISFRVFEMPRGTDRLEGQPA